MTAITAAQLRAARAMLGWMQSRLAKASGVSLPTIKRIEPGKGPLPVRASTAEAIMAALERAGVEFIAENGGGPGVRLRKRGKK
jgi:transcriptional regulator with XRE-family HTH domain